MGNRKPAYSNWAGFVVRFSSAGFSLRELLQVQLPLLATKPRRLKPALLLAPRKDSSKVHLKWAILVQGLAKPVRGPFVYLPRSNSLQAPFRARRNIESHRVRYLRMINPGNLPESPARLSVTLRAGIKL